jgi:FtsZ-binding cell division protein ZapB
MANNNAIVEIETIKKKLEELKIKKARLQERLEAAKRQRDHLVSECRNLGVEDPSKLSEWVAEQQRQFNELRDAVLERLNVLS